eukprot:6657136-Prorocentrum_lima.AAC.1
MTSSLVGSEMCIRDRCLVGAVVEHIRRSWVSCIIRLYTLWDDAQNSDEAVSYTHLTLPTICSV